MPLWVASIPKAGCPELYTSGELSWTQATEQAWMHPFFSALDCGCDITGSLKYLPWPHGKMMDCNIKLWAKIRLVFPSVAFRQGRFNHSSQNETRTGPNPVFLTARVWAPLHGTDHTCNPNPHHAHKGASIKWDEHQIQVQPAWVQLLVLWCIVFWQFS